MDILNGTITENKKMSLYIERMSNMIIDYIINDKKFGTIKRLEVKDRISSDHHILISFDNMNKGK